jgi:hypothetical protein
MSICPVCGRGRVDPAEAFFKEVVVSHLACVERLEIDLSTLDAKKESAIERAYDEMDRKVRLLQGDRTRAEFDTKQAEREAAFWKWLWEHEVDEYLQGNASWLAHMRKRFEKEGT